MDFRELNYIVTIAKYQNVSRAAQELYVSQPTLSKFVQNLEKELGQPLFKRLGNRFSLTYAGERYVAHAKTILSAKKELDDELSDIMKYNIGEMKIAFPMMRSNYMLPCTLPVFSEKFPNVKLTIREADSGRLEEYLLDGSVDLAFITLPVQSRDLAYEKICREEIVLVMSPDHPAAKKYAASKSGRYPWLNLQEIKNERFLLQKNDQRSRRIADMLMREAGIVPASVLEIRDILSAVKLAARGYGVCFVDETHLRHIECSPAVFSVGNLRTETSFVAAYRKGVYLPSYMREYIQIVRDFT